ncbi:RNA-dependent RNA polymerase [Thalictrum thalictroides]|uniref:RNA-dependent RNA polymerase n=1 Tax=Thalictrum thalictroides TaxID=46969 RepID=A0A7J6VD19_THATH|nr:RNA-dependent RNA polymerase [Thalictrum thalictroides]
MFFKVNYIYLGSPVAAYFAGKEIFMKMSISIWILYFILITNLDPKNKMRKKERSKTTEALQKAWHGDIIFKQNPLLVNLGPENTIRLNQQRKDTKPFKFSDVILEVGTLVTRNEFLVGWKGPISGVDFVVDPFDGTCKFLSRGGHGSLESSRHLFYQTADDDIYDSVPFDLLDDDDPWIRTTDFTPGERSEVSITALRHICSYRLPVFDSCKRLKLVQEWLIKNPKLLQISKTSIDSVEVRRLVITPTKAYCLPPEVELSNRILRKFMEVVDRFLRVTFMDEGMQQLNSNVLNYYVAPIVKDIKSTPFPQKTGVFKRDRNVAKCAARIGLCFSSTYATLEVPWEMVNLEHPEIERNSYYFSDGIGMLTPDLATQVAEKLQLSKNAPSAYQIRFTGRKGVIACWP